MCARSAGAMIAIAFVHNLLRRHPACTVLLHRPIPAAARSTDAGTAATEANQLSNGMPDASQPASDQPGTQSQAELQRTGNAKNCRREGAALSRRGYLSSAVLKLVAGGLRIDHSIQSAQLLLKQTCRGYPLWRRLLRSRCLCHLAHSSLALGFLQGSFFSSGFSDHKWLAHMRRSLQAQMCMMQLKRILGRAEPLRAHCGRLRACGITPVPRFAVASHPIMLTVAPR